MLISIPLYKKVQQRLDKVLLRSRENLSGARVIRAFCKEDEEIEEFEDANRQLTHSQKFVGAISALMNPLTYLIINLGIVFLVWHGALGVDSGTIKQGQLVALYSYMSQILIELIKLANLIITLTKAAASGNRIASVFEIKSSQATEENSNESVGDKSSIIEFRDVSLRYKNAGDDSLSHISFSVKAGETVGIIGATGSGKTSLVNMIPRFYDASEGTVLFCGEDIKTLDVEKVREKIGIVPQKAVLFKGSIRDNIKWGKSDASDDEILEACRAAQAIDVVNSKQDGLDAEVEQSGRNFSGGQRQRLTIARALVKSPEILILDDSSSALDFATDAALRKAIASLSYKPTVFVVSQRASSIQYADKIVVLEDGEMVGIGTHGELLKNCDVYREIYDSQFKKEVV
jgi:ABC-type multidrug transport system fused ATPase/permease subunit